MSVAVLDAGNSKVKLFSWDGPDSHPKEDGWPQLTGLGSWNTPCQDDPIVVLAEQIASCLAEHQLQRLVVTSVLPRLTAQLLSQDLDLEVVDHCRPMSFGVEVDNPSAVGADRYCNIAAVHASGLREALVVDVGSATTFDLLVGGNFCGGLIAPGPQLALDCLGSRAARLEPVPFKPQPIIAGKNTRQAMERGGWNSGLGGIMYCVNGLLEHHGQRPVVLTGGLAASLVQPGWRYEPQLTLRGALILAGQV